MNASIIDRPAPRKAEHCGIIVTDERTYFRVAGPNWNAGGGASNFPKSFDGFRTADELLDYLLSRHQ